MAVKDLSDNAWAYNFVDKEQISQCLFHPDCDHNAMKVVLDKFMEWRESHRLPKDKTNPWSQPKLTLIAIAMGPELKVLHGYEQTVNILCRKAWDDPAPALRAMRAAFESVSS